MSTKSVPAAVLLAVVCLVSAGCSQAPIAQPRLSEKELADRSRTLLVAYAHNESPLLRSHAIEALAETRQTAAANAVLEGLNDKYWGVRFTAAMAIMDLKYAPARPLLVRHLADPDKSVQAAAAGALHVLGDKRQEALLAGLLFDTNVLVRRNTATVLGRMGDTGAVKLLKPAIRDKDMSLRLQVLEAMTLLGYGRATQLMVSSYCRSVYDDECILAMMTLAKVRCREAIEPLGYIFEQSKSPDRFGMRLVAARALAMLDDFRGRDAALEGLQYYSGRLGKASTIRTLSAMALGEMKDKSLLGPLEKTLADNDPDVQIAAAAAILKIVQSDPEY